MNLTDLWGHERARLSAEITGALPARLHEIVDAAITEEKTSRSSRLGSDGVKSSPMSHDTPSMPMKRKPSIFVKRDQLFRRLVEQSVVPVAPVLPIDHRVHPTSSLFDQNEFAIEYAERAPRRLYGQATPPQSSTTTQLTSSANSTSASTAVASNRPLSSLSSSPIRKEKKLSTSSSPRASSRGNVHLAIATTVAAKMNSTNPNSPTSKPSILIRKNGRKRLGTEFSSHVLRPYVGDMFGVRGEYIDGMIYMARMKKTYTIQPGAIDIGGPIGAHSVKDAVSDALAAANSNGGGSTEGNGGEESSGNTASSTGTTTQSQLALASVDEDLIAMSSSSTENPQLTQRQRCSLTLSNWSSNPENARLMVQENVIEALILLSQTQDKFTRLNCVTALMNLSHVVELRSVIVRQGAVKTVSEIVNDTDNKIIRTACAITLCNLCCLDGEEELLVEDGAVGALSVLINEHEKVSGICRCALFNLTCVSEPYHNISSVLKVFVTLTSSSTTGGVGALSSSSISENDEITAKALCNLSNFKRVRLRLIEEGIVTATTSLIHANQPHIQQMLAYVLLNLSAVRACRSEMVAKGCMSTLVALTGATKEKETKFLIGSTLWNLSKEPGNRLRMVFEGVLLLVNDLCHRSTNAEALRSVCARTLYNVSCNEDTRVKLVERDAVTILSSLSKRSSDGDAKKMCTLALCNLLSVQQAAADIMTAGAITALIQLSMAPSNQTIETNRLFAKALHGLCEKATTRGAMVHAGVIPAIIYLSCIEEDGRSATLIGVDDENSSRSSTTDGTDSWSTLTKNLSQNRKAGLLTEIRARCTAALACLAADEQLANQVCTREVVQCVTRILVLERSNIANERFCCSCLSLLCRDEQCSLILADEGAIQVILSICMESPDLETKASCCHVLASMACHPSCCLSMVQMGVISVLATLSKIKGDTGIQRCCAITLANLSAEPAIREILVTAGTVSILTALSNSYSEDSQRDCAKVLCNLSCIPGKEAHLVAEGAVGVLMMIAMVRAVSANTKEICVRALFNLLNAETMKHLVQEGLVKVLPAFCELETNSVSELAMMLFSKLLNHPVGRNALCSERSALHALFMLMERSTKKQQYLELLYENLLCELVYYENSRLPSVHAGIIHALHRIACTNDVCIVNKDDPDNNAIIHHCTAKKLAMVLFTLSKTEETRAAAATPASLVVLTQFLELHSPKKDCDASECVIYAVSTLCLLSCHDSTRAQLHNPEICVALIRMLRSNDVVGPFDGGDITRQVYPPAAIKTCLLTFCCLSRSHDLLDSLLRLNIMDCLYGILIGQNPDSDVMIQPHNLMLIADFEFVALVCILYRQLSHTSQFEAIIGRQSEQSQQIIHLFCTLTALAVEKNIPDSCLDCADALCSITFTPTAVAPTSHSTISPIKKTSKICPQPPSCSSPGPVARRSTAALLSKNVLEAIESLLSDSQLPETRWRCCASLWTLSFVPEYRSQLVSLGAARLLVSESYRAATCASLSTLKCCAGALCNLTIVSNECSNANAARMVEDEVVPALIQLAKLEHDDVREYCTLALSNLSSQSPKVESGAVSALLNLSLRFTTDNVHAHAPVQKLMTEACLLRPPRVCDERYKTFSAIPDFTMEIEGSFESDGGRTMPETKYEAGLEASTPPLPHLPTIPADLDTNGSFRGPSDGNMDAESSKAKPNVTLLKKLKSSSDGDLRTSVPMSFSDRDDTNSSCPIVRFFPKVDPTESCLMIGIDDGDSTTGVTTPSSELNGREDGSNQDFRDGISDSLSDELCRLGSGHNNAFNGDDSTVDIDASEQGESLGQLRQRSNRTISSSVGSPLVRTVIRKTQTIHAAKKLMALKSRIAEKHGGISENSTMATSFSTPTLHSSTTAQDRVLNGSGNTASLKSPMLSRTGTRSTKNLMLDAPELSSEDAKKGTVVPLSVRENNDNNKPYDDDNPRTALIAAAMAAGIYSSPLTISSNQVHVESMKKHAIIKKKKKKRCEPPKLAVLKTAARVVTPDTELASPPIIFSATVKELHLQTKKLGLWN